jgi:hypothetical protein
MRALKAAVVVMGVLIVLGLGVVVVTIVSRMRAAPAAPRGPATEALLDEPAGTRIAGVSLVPDRLAVRLQGGGPDRVVVVDTASGRVVARIGLAK